jgi:hypothetical protein
MYCSLAMLEVLFGLGPDSDYLLLHPAPKSRVGPASTSSRTLNTGPLRARRPDGAFNAAAEVEHLNAAVVAGYQRTLGGQRNRVAHRYRRLQRPGQPTGSGRPSLANQASAGIER